MKPIIGLCSNYSYDDIVGITAKLGANLQEWQLLADDYIQAVEKAGGLPIIIPVCKNPENLKEYLKIINGIIFTGGNDISPQYYNESFTNKLGDIIPERDEQEIDLAKNIIENTKIPVLGICRGAQVINIACRGKLYQDLEGVTDSNHFATNSPKDHPVHEISIQKDSLLYNILNKEKAKVNSFHHQSIKNVGQNIRVVAKSNDNIIEAIEYSGENFVLGLQWHPEMMFKKSEDSFKIFQGFVKRCSILI